MYRSDSRFGHRDRSRDAERHREPGKPPRGRVGTIAALCTIGLLASWAGAATLYILFRDDALKLIAEQQVSTMRAYEAQVAGLQAEIERLKSLKLIDQERVDRAVADLARRQTLIEKRQAALIALGAGKSDGHDLAPETTGSVPPPAPLSTLKPSPLSDTILITSPAERVARLESRPLPPLDQGLDARLPETATADVRLVNLSRDLAQIEAAQNRALNEVEEHYDGRAKRMRKMIADLGMRPARDDSPTGDAANEPGAGGPFLPWVRSPEDPFTRQVLRIRNAALDVAALEKEIVAVPVRRPTLGEADVTSAFGMRIDPFLRQPAIHTGIDFRGNPGDAVRATAAGQIVQAQRNGGYGLMVEIDHGNGLATRYAHLSAITVSAGGDVAPGDIIGRVGSTGRSTGPHLHYEVRFNGEAVDPQRFLRAGLRLENP